MISGAGDKGIKAVDSCNGVACISKLLSSSDDEAVHNLSCSSISSLIEGNEGRLQTAIDSGVVPSLKQLVLSKGHSKDHALLAIYAATESGTVHQIKYLAEMDCISALCSLLHEDATNSSITAVRTLKNVSSDDSSAVEAISYSFSLQLISTASE